MFAVIPRSCRSTLRRLADDRRGATVVTMALAMTVLLGFAGAGVDVAVWETTKRDMQGAADQAAFSAAITAGAGSQHAITNAKAITANMGFVDGQQGATIIVNNPPSQGSFSTNNLAWEVIVRKPQQLWFANVFLGSPPLAAARAVALPVGAIYCMLVLDSTGAQALDLQGTPALNTPNCGIQVNSSSTTAVAVGGSATITAKTLSIVGNYTAGNAAHINAIIKTGAAAVADPYANVAMPAQPALCVALPVVSAGSLRTYSPGCYPTGIHLTGNTTNNFLPGIYWIPTGQQLQITKGTSTGNGVTFVLVGTATVDFGANSTTDFKAPAVGPTAGLIFFQDRNTPITTTNNLGGGSNQKFTGALYFPTVSLNYSGNAATQYCTQLIVRRVSFQGNSGFQSNCTGIGTASITNKNVQLAE